MHINKGAYEMEHNGPDGTRSIPLVKSTRYESFQFHATSEPNYGLSAEQLLSMEILDIYRWVVNRCREKDLPDALKKIPSIDDFKDFKKDDIVSFRHDIGYKLEVAFTDDKKTWSMQIVEPDRGPYPDKPELNRVVVPGRLFETNIGLKIIENTVEIGTKTYVDEPIGTTAECGAFIQKFLKKFMGDQYITLKEYNIPITSQPHHIKSKDWLQSLCKWLNSNKRQHLAVIYVETEKRDDEKNKDNQNEATEKENNEMLIVEDGKSYSLNDDYIKYFNNLANFFKGYAFFFYVPKDKRQNFIDNTGYNLDNRDLLLIEANKYKNEKYKAEDLILSISEYKNNLETKSIVDKKIEKSTEKREFEYGKVKFISDIRNKTIEDLYDEINNLKVNIKKLEEDKLSLQKENMELHINIGSEKDNLVKKLRDKDDEIYIIKKEFEELKNNKPLEIVKRDIQIAKLRQQMEYKNKYTKRPRHFSDIYEWVKESFPDKLILTSKAKNNIKNVDGFDLDEICDALEYLGTDYYDYKLSKIDNVELTERCITKYSKVFRITPIEANGYNEEHLTSSYKSKGGKNQKIVCDDHLYLTKRSDARIYFTYHKDDKCIIIGNLPYHAPSLSEN